MDESQMLEQLQAVICALPDPVFILTESGRYADIIGGNSRRFYHNSHPLIGKNLVDVLPHSKAEWFLCQILNTLETQTQQTVEYGLSAADVDGLVCEEGPAGMLWFEGRIQPLPSLYQGERAVVWVARNISERYQLEHKLRRLAEVDELTGIFNRRKILAELESRFNEFKRYMSPTSLLIIDFDYFKQINDKFGHLCGDEVIKSVVNACLAKLRKADLFARLGGEEFAVLLPNTELAEAKPLAERLRLAVCNDELSVLPEPWPVTISIGMSQFLATDSRKQDCIARADKALFEAKDAGRNCVRVDAGISSQLKLGI